MKKLLTITLLAVLAVGTQAQNVVFTQEQAKEIYAEIAASKAKDKLILALEANKLVQDKLITSLEDLNAQKDMTIKAKDVTIEKLIEMKCSIRTFKFLFIVHRTKRCL